MALSSGNVGKYKFLTGKDILPEKKLLKKAATIFNLVDNQYQQKSKVLYTFKLNKSYVYLLNAEPINLMFLKTWNIEIDNITMAFTDQNSRLSETEKLIWHCLLINRDDTLFHRTKKKKICQRIWISFICEKSINFGCCIKTGLEDLKAATKKVTHKAAESTAEFIRSKIADKIVKSKLVSYDNLKNVEEIIIPTEKREEILDELRQVL